MIDVDNAAGPAHLQSAPTRTVVSLMITAALGSAAFTATAQTGAAPSQPSQPAAPLPPSSAASAADVGGKSATGVQRIDTVTITATRRREPAREVPMQVDLVSTERLESGGAKNLSDYVAGQAGVDVSAGGAGLGTLSIRGVTTGTQPISSVGTYIDDVAFGSSTWIVRGSTTALDMGLLDLNHIEILRGPQGTLYGAGAMGGLLKYVTNEPDTHLLSGKVSLGGSTTQNGATGNTVSALVNVPLKEDFAGLRASLFRDHVGGYVDAVGPAAGRDINGGNTVGGRVSLLIEPSARTRVRLTATSQEIKRDSEDVVDYNVLTGKPVDGDLTRRLALREPYSTKVELAAADIEYDMGWARLNSISSTQTARLNQTLDYTGVYAPLLAGAGLNVATVPVDLYAKLRKYTQELRLTSASDKNFEWLAGLFYTHEDGKNQQLVGSTVTGAVAGPDLLSAGLPSKYTEAAVYVDGTWKATSTLSITAGIRVARNRQDFSQASAGLLTGGAVTLQGQSAETSKTYLGTVSYALTPTSNLYVRAASGYRPGGPNAVILDANGQPVAPPSFQHDSLWSYEAGYKADLLDRRLSIESSVYDIRWDQIQQVFAVNGVGVIVNGGKAHIQGIEFTATYRPTTQWTLNGNATYIDARLSEAGPGLGSSGARLPDTARLAASLGADYRFAWAGRAAYVGATQRFVGARNAGFDGSTSIPNYRMPGYALTDLESGIDWGRYQLALYLRNVFNRAAQLAANTGTVALGGPAGVTVARPRTAGATLSASF